jgi:hypothetical protein
MFLLQLITSLVANLYAAVNDAPTFVKGASTVTVLEDPDAYSAPWATSISAGPQETDQSTSFNVACNNTVLFSAAPQLSPAGLLSFAVAAGNFGSSACSVTLDDSEGAKSATEQLTIVVTPGERLWFLTQCLADIHLLFAAVDCRT